MIFLSYAREDRGHARDLEERLSSAGYLVSKDEPMPESNAFWRLNVLEGMRGARVLLVVWSTNALASPWVDQEIRAFEGVRVWYRVDDAIVPGVSDRDVAVRGWSRLNDVLSAFVVKGGRTARPRAVADSWRPWGPGRRSRALARAEAALRRFRTQRFPRRVARDLSADHLLMEESGMTFRRVVRDVFLLDRPVTVDQYRRFLEESRTPGHPAIDLRTSANELPVTAVSWFEATACAEWFGGALPTEGEWQRAAAASKDLRYATASGDIDASLAWFGRDFASDGPRSASRYPSNPAGFHGLCGNTWDWCRTRWGGHRVIRGGSWMDRPAFCTVAARYRNAPLDRDCAVGFRIRVRATQHRSGHYELIRPGISR